MFSRLESLIGKENLDKIKSKKVLVVGIGGVGGYVCEALARCGVSKIIIVDYDSVDITNINRQIIAGIDTLEQKKVIAMENRLKNINPDILIKTFDCAFSNETKQMIFAEKPDFLIDCCDMIDAKKLFIKEALEKEIEFISCMGTAKKIDPTKLEIVDIRKTYNDPLAKILRKYVKELKTNKKVMVLSSKELPIVNGKVLASAIFVPATAGILIANYVIRKIIK